MLNSNVGNRGAEKGIWTKFTFPWPSEGPATDEGTSASESCCTVLRNYIWEDDRAIHGKTQFP